MALGLFENLGHDAGADGLATFTDSETHLLLERDGRNEFDGHGDVVTRHNHLDAFRQDDASSDVRRADVELGAVVREERRVSPALFLLQDVYFALELLVRLDATGLGQNLAALDAFLVDSRRRQPTLSPAWPSSICLRNISTPVTTVFDSLSNPMSSTVVVDLDDAAFDTARGHRPTTLDREHVLDGHEERLVDLSLRLRDVAVESREQLVDLRFPLAGRRKHR